MNRKKKGKIMKKFIIQSKDSTMTFECENIEWSGNGLKLSIGNNVIAFFQIWDFWYEVKDDQNLS
jgi:hypothetical protein